MRNYIRYIFSAILIVIAASGCTRNDGDIGPWFGQWKLVALSQGGAPVADYQDNIFFSFQSNVFQIITVKGEFDRSICWANWTDGGSTVTIDFAHREDGSAEIDWNYTPPAILGARRGKAVGLGDNPAAEPLRRPGIYLPPQKMGLTRPGVLGIL